jgi:hypothetical protein
MGDFRVDKHAGLLGESASYCSTAETCTTAVNVVTGRDSEIAGISTTTANHTAQYSTHI